MRYHGRNAAHTDGNREFQRPPYTFQWFFLMLIAFTIIDFLLYL
jgi:hypothetical protein